MNSSNSESNNGAMGLYGLGVVGQGFYQYLSEASQTERLQWIVIRDGDKERPATGVPLFSANKSAELDKNYPQLIVELIPPTHSAYQLIVAQLTRGGEVITANKKILAQHLEEFLSLQQEHKGHILYEGAVCGSIPIVRVLNDFFGHEEILAVSGILNGSSNYILSKQFDQSIDFQTALEEAQKKGFAEADPTSDVGGYDAMYKLILIAAHAFGYIASTDDVVRYGIEHINAEDIAFAKQYNLKIKLIASAKKTDSKMTMSVLPTLVSQSRSLYSVDDEYNGVEVEGARIGQHFYRGKGAGSAPTGAIVYGDLIALDQGYRYHYGKWHANSNTELRLDLEETVRVAINRPKNASLEKIEHLASNWKVICDSPSHLWADVTLDALQKNESLLKEMAITPIVIPETEYSLLT